MLKDMLKDGESIGFVATRLLPETHKEIKELAKAAGLRKAAFVREILEEYTATGQFKVTQR